jgi:putative methyltransferase (TIGR04325 family)
MNASFYKFAIIIRKCLPGFVVSWIAAMLYGWKGNYSSWAEAESTCTGYDAENILEKVRDAALKVKNGEAVYERDSVTFDRVQYSFPLLSALMWVAAKNGGRVNVLDFGGSLGSSFFQNRKFLDSLTGFNWCIVEQPHFVETGKKLFSVPGLHFFFSMKECTESFPIDIILFSSVLQYMEKPYALLEEVFSLNVPFIFVDRTFFLDKGDDRITIQKVPEWIYKAEYCCWFFNEKKFLDFFSSRYTLLFDYRLPEVINIKSVYKGFFFKRDE